MAGHSKEEILKTIKTFRTIGFILLAGTILTVAVANYDFGAHWLNITIGLAIATIKGSLVCLYFMHLIDERKVIYAVMASTVFFFIGLMILTMTSYGDMPAVAIH